MEYRNGERELRLVTYLYDPAKLTDINGLKRRDISAIQDIEQCRSMIQELGKYRLELAKRAQELTTMDKHIKVSLIREKRWQGNVYYHLIKENVYSDGTSETVEKKVYAGKHRYTAIQAFRECKKRFPQYEYYENIEKNQWE